ncbi:MAG: deoxyribodipyrimidine photo-lyase [Candidatus Sericytochromatia bacterium]
MSRSPVLLWFRQDLRLGDHPALQAALAAGEVIPVFIWEPEAGAPWARGAASRWWLHFSLESLAKSLADRGSRLILRQGQAEGVLKNLLRETGAQEIFASRRYEPALAKQDQALSQLFQFHFCTGTLLSEPGSVRNGSGGPYKVFTPYWRACLQQLSIAPPLPAPSLLPAVNPALASLPLSALGLLPKLPWDTHMRQSWNVGEPAALKRLADWSQGALSGYPESRNRPDQLGTSRLSPHLHLGELSPRQIWWALKQGATHQPPESCRVFLSEIGWREFAYQILVHFPHTDLNPLDDRFSQFDWQDRPDWLKSWQMGQTGYPIVDAGMRELWALGWMHNRVRMIVASFLTKDLMLPWQAGAKWFWDTLVDADLPANSLNWQWTAGCGADAAPYFRIFNPVSQGEKFDPQGEYVRKWVPELALLPDKWLHKPWEAPPLVLLEAGVRLGENYPLPLVDHKLAREAALAAFARIKLPKSLSPLA